MIAAAGTAVSRVMKHVASFFPHSPAERGPFSGPGWTALRKSGRAIITEVASGITDHPQVDLARVISPRIKVPDLSALGAALAVGTGGDGAGGRGVTLQIVNPQVRDLVDDVHSARDMAATLMTGF